MFSAMEELMRFHPASQIGRREPSKSDLAAFEELECRHLYPRHEYETDRSEPTGTIGELAAAAAMLVVFIGVLTVIARFAVDAPDTAPEPVVAISDAAELR